MGKKPSGTHTISASCQPIPNPLEATDSTQAGRRSTVRESATQLNEWEEHGMGRTGSIAYFRRKAGTAAFVGLTLSAVSGFVVATHAAEIANVDEARIASNAQTGREWPSVGFDYGVHAL